MHRSGNAEPFRIRVVNYPCKSVHTELHSRVIILDIVRIIVYNIFGNPQGGKIRPAILVLRGVVLW